jgi:adenylyltransferase/sulfurtransferase
VPDWVITPSELEKELKQVVLVDVREPEEHEESRIDGCKLIPLGEIQARAGELNSNDDIVLYCAHGMRSLQALMALRMLGFESLRSLEGGIAAWQEHLASKG